jgi:Putative auto-transporter adhesin, head GIN domain
VTNLTKYDGNFIDFIDNEVKDFRAKHENSFNTLVNQLDIDVSCKVAVLPCETGASVKIDTENIDDFRVYMDGDRLVVKQKAQNNISINSINGSTVIGNVRGNMSIINGEVFVNGQRINPLTQKQVSPSQVIIYCPQRVRLDASLSGQATLASKVIFTKSKVNLAGQGTLGIATESLKVKISGQGNSYIVMRGGDLDISLSGQGDLRVKGEWQDADVSLSGMGRVDTEGKCLGDYSGRVSGMGKIRHTGLVSGRVSEKVSGMGSCQIQR